jgi:hypothetical protein
LIGKRSALGLDLGIVISHLLEEEDQVEHDGIELEAIHRLKEEVEVDLA